jgi:hypothetical protein
MLSNAFYLGNLLVFHILFWWFFIMRIYQTKELTWHGSSDSLTDWIDGASTILFWIKCYHILEKQRNKISPMFFLLMTLNSSS